MRIAAHARVSYDKVVIAITKSSSRERHFGLRFASGRVVVTISLKFVFALLLVYRYKTGTDGLFGLNVPTAIEVTRVVRAA